MSLEQLIINYGYFAVAIFSCIEGEVAVVSAGILASQGLLDIKFVCLSAFIGTWATEQSLFFIGRYYGNRIIKRFPRLKEKFNKVLKFVRKYDSIYIFSFRFIYGIRNISPLVIGTALVKPIKYCILNFLAAATWALIVPCLGYFFAETIKSKIDNISHYYAIIGAFILFITIAPYTIYKIHQVRSKNKK